MRRLVLVVGFLFFITLTEGQQISQKDSLDVNEVSMLIYSNGMTSNDILTYTPGYKIPKGTGQTAIYTMGLWITGIESSTLDTHLVANTYGGEFLGEGPIARNYNSAYKNRYGRLWKINKSEIDYHRNNWFKTGYVMIPEISTWPAHGDITNGEAYNLAPYIDYDQNGKYEPHLGDYPCIKGDQAVYTISNDQNVDSTYRYSNFPLEIHTMAYGFVNGTIIDSTTFLEYKIVNRTSNKLENVYIGLFQDADAGCADDDYVGCDSNLNTFFTYNGDDFDQDCRGALGYAYARPVIGTVFLNHPMTSFIYYDRGTSPLRGDPVNEEHHYNYMQAKWKDGSDMVYGGNGHPSDPSSTNQKVKYMFPSDPGDTLGWNEVSAGNPPFDRRGLGSTGPFTIQPNESVELALGIVFAADSNSNLFDIYRNNVSYVQNFYDNNIHYCQNWATGVDTPMFEVKIKIYPNPTDGELNIEIPNSKTDISMEVYDAFGRMVHISTIPKSRYVIDVSDWTRGMYFIKLSDRKEMWIEKVLIE